MTTTTTQHGPSTTQHRQTPTSADPAPTRRALGPGEARSAIYTTYWPLVITVIRGQLRPGDRGNVEEDLAQTTFLRAWPYLDNGVEVSQQRYWTKLLAIIARRAVCDFYRRGPRRLESAVSPDAPLWGSIRAATTGPGEGPDDDATLAVLARAWQNLPAQTQTALRLRVIGGLPWWVTGLQMHRGKDTVRRLTAEGVELLRAELLAEGLQMAFPTSHRAVSPTRCASLCRGDAALVVVHSRT